MRNSAKCGWVAFFQILFSYFAKKLQGGQDSPDLQMQHKWTPTLPHIFDLKQPQKLFQDLYV